MSILCFALCLGIAAAGAPDARSAAVHAEVRDVDRIAHPFAITDEMRAWADDAAVGCREPGDRLKCLRNALFRRSFTYDATVFDARTAFERRAGNCLAFTTLFVAMARHLRVDVRMARARVRPVTDREGDLVLVRGHVVALWRHGTRRTVFDFQQEPENLILTPLDDREVAAVVQVARGTSLLRVGDPHAAVGHLELATHLDPDWLGARVDLAVAYRRAGRPDEALEALRQVLTRDPAHASALVNLAALQDVEGRSELVLRSLRAAGASDPTAFALVSLARAELARGDVRAAKRAARRARWMRPRTPEAVETLAEVARVEDNLRRARRYRARALALRTRTDIPLPFR